MTKTILVLFVFCDNSNRGEYTVGCSRCLLLFYRVVGWDCFCKTRRGVFIFKSPPAFSSTHVLCTPTIGHLAWCNCYIDRPSTSKYTFCFFSTATLVNFSLWHLWASDVHHAHYTIWKYDWPKLVQIVVNKRFYNSNENYGVRRQRGRVENVLNFFPYIYYKSCVWYPSLFDFIFYNGLTIFFTAFT